ncbi:MAG: hypothetical protein HYT27_03430 [Parcubacteria group bacterium]|nr:hypothetical protein [Parcubacteria group bacterium]
MVGLKSRGRPPIKMAESVKDVVNFKDPYAREIMDVTKPISDDLVGAILAQSVMTWEGRNPAPALDEDGNFQGTDMDLFSFLVPLAHRNAVIEIPRYRNRRKIVVKETERKIGTNQFGKITGLVSNKDVLSFSVRLWDMTIAKENKETGEESIGAHRAYMIVDCDGHWYDGWDKIVFNPTAPENKFLTEKELWTGNTVYFKFYVHPNRWQSVFSAQHLLKLLLIERIDSEAKFYRGEMKRLEEKGFSLPEGVKPAYEPAVYEGTTAKIQVHTIEFELDYPGFSGVYVSVPDSQKGLVDAYQRQKYLTYTLKPQVRFVVRANETAYFYYGLEGFENKVAPWMEGRKWVSGYRTPKGRVDWNFMRLGPEMALRYRTKLVTQQVSAE